jgi:GxxExxY protein
MDSEETGQVLGACFEVYRVMGPGFLESVYQECLSLEFKSRNIPFIPQKQMSLEFKGVILQQTYQADFICFDRIILEIKAMASFVKDHEAQVLNYLRATRVRVGLLVNFGHAQTLQVKRLIV